MSARIDPEAAAAEMRAAGAEPLEEYPGRTVDRWRIQCVRCGTKGTTRLSAIRSGKSACYPCARARGGERNRKFAADTAVDAMRAAGVEPLEPYSGKVIEPWRVRCLTCGSEGTPSLRNVTKGQGACGPCGQAGRVDPRHISEAEALERLADLGVEPLGTFPGKLSVPWPVRCLTCRDEFSVDLHASMGQGVCRTCGYANRKPARLLGEDAARSEMDRAGLDPIEPYPGNVYTPWKARCRRCRYEVAPRVGSLRSGQGGCRYCGSGIGDPDHGFSGTDPAYVYLVTSPDHRAIKVGIANVGSERPKQHRRAGWSVLAEWPLASGADARRLEERVLARWSEFDRGVAPEDMPQGGHTETVSLDDVSEAEAVALIEGLIAAMDG